VTWPGLQVPLALPVWADWVKCHTAQQRFNLGSATFVPLLQVGSETVHFPNESPAGLKQCLATLQMGAANRMSPELRSGPRTALDGE
jgi:hypothetical protein